MGRLLEAPRAFRRRDRGPQCQHVRLRLAPPRVTRPRWKWLPTSARGSRADLRGRPPRYRPDLRRYPRAGRQLRPGRHQGNRRCQGEPASSRSPAASPVRRRPEHQEPHAPGRDRPHQSQKPAPPRHVRVRQGDHRSPDVRTCRDRADLQRREDLCWQHENGKAVRTEVQTGVSDEKYIEPSGSSKRRHRHGTPGDQSTARNR